VITPASGCRNAGNAVARVCCATHDGRFHFFRRPMHKARLRVGPDICMSRPPVALFSSASFAMIEATVVLAILVHAFRFNVVTGHRPDPVARVRLGCERLWVRRFTSGSRSAAIVDDERAVRCKRAPRPGIPTGRGLGNPPSSASKLFLVMRAPPTRTRTRISNQAGLLAASGGLGGCNARRGAASSRMTDRPRPARLANGALRGRR
jgi:hypothetical protein